MVRKLHLKAANAKTLAATLPHAVSKPLCVQHLPCCSTLHPAFHLVWDIDHPPPEGVWARNALFRVVSHYYKYHLGVHFITNKIIAQQHLRWIWVWIWGWICSSNKGDFQDGLQGGLQGGFTPHLRVDLRWIWGGFEGGFEVDLRVGLRRTWWWIWWWIWGCIWDGLKGGFEVDLRVDLRVDLLLGSATSLARAHPP